MNKIIGNNLNETEPINLSDTQNSINQKKNCISKFSVFDSYIQLIFYNLIFYKLIFF